MKYSYLVYTSRGDAIWYSYPKNIHKENGPAIEFTDGAEMWYRNNLRHRVDGPAISFNNGDRMWYRHGKLHRLFGPAVMWARGHREWHIFGILIIMRNKYEWNR